MQLQQYKCDFIEFMVRCGVLTFGDFTTKSGRRTPYFVNTGHYRTGAQLSTLAGYYAQAIRDHLGEAFDVLFGPAYKGIPLAAATALTLARDHGHDVAYCFDRKEVKDHGEGGRLVGHNPVDGDRILIIEDVTTAGTSVRGTVPILQAAADIRLAGLVISVDRQERGSGDQTGLEELCGLYSMPTFAIVTVREVMDYLADREVDGQVVLDEDTRRRMVAYLEEFGPRN